MIGSTCKAALVSLLAAVFVFPMSAARSSAQLLSRVYVSAYPCGSDQDAPRFGNSLRRSVTLYDRVHYGESHYDGFRPPVTVEKDERGEVLFTFDVAPGNYDVFIKLPSRPSSFLRNGPLTVIAGHDRHLVIGGCGLTDWHDVAAVAGDLSIRDINISLLVFDHPVKCGDDAWALDEKLLRPVVGRQRSDATLDDGAYYVNFHGYGKQDHNLALVFSGALFTRGAVLLTNTPDTAPGKPPLILKNITPAIVQTALRSTGKLVCIPGF